MDKQFCIFDMDGTLVDSMPIWKSLGRDYLEARGCRPTPAQLAAMGPMTMLEGARYMMDTFGVEGPPEHIIDEMHAVMEGHYRTDIPLKPGIEAYLDRLKGAGARLCVATATAEPLARACLERLGVVKYFDFILSCETVGAGKTKPDVYLEAARRLGGCPADTAVFEDALYAAQTARKAGFYVVGIPEASYEDDWPALEELADETILDWREGPMTVSQRLYEAAKPIWQACHDHPFVRGIGDGSLDREKFRYFLLQDYLYLFDYAKVFAWGVVKADDPELMRFFSANVDAILGGEMKTHRAYMARMGITEEQVFQVKPALANLSYTHYMLAAAAAGGPAEIMASILACSWSYAEIGARLAQVPGAADHPFYGEWVRGYASEEYQNTNAALVARLDALAGGCSEEQYRRLEDIFVACSRYELGFWEMAWRLEA